MNGLVIKRHPLHIEWGNVKHIEFGNVLANVIQYVMWQWHSSVLSFIYISVVFTAVVTWAKFYSFTKTMWKYLFWLFNYLKLPDLEYKAKGVRREGLDLHMGTTSRTGSKPNEDRLRSRQEMNWGKRWTLSQIFFQYQLKVVPRIILPLNTIKSIIQISTY